MATTSTSSTPKNSPTPQDPTQKPSTPKSPSQKSPIPKLSSKSPRPTPPFAPGKSWQKLCLIFIIGCLFGCLYEMILNFIVALVNDHVIYWEARSAVLYGPFSVVYGFGAVLMTIFLVNKDYKWQQIFIYGALICGIFEYLMSFLQETFTGTISWTYEAHLLNINGRTSVEIMCVWGIICLLYVYFIYPAIDRLTQLIPAQPANLILYAVMIFLCFDMLLSLSAVIRQGLRHHHTPPLTPYGEFLDQHYPDERIRESYHNMEFTTE